jgi:hypothetical protein
MYRLDFVCCTLDRAEPGPSARTRLGALRGQTALFLVVEHRRLRCNTASFGSLAPPRISPYLNLDQLLYPHRDREVTEELGQTINLAFYTDAAVVRLDDLPGDG